MASKIQRWEKYIVKEKSIIDQRSFIEEVPEAKRKRVKKRPKVSEAEQLSIAHDVLVEHQSQTAVAKGARLSIPRISAIVKKASATSNVFSLMREKHYEA